MKNEEKFKTAEERKIAHTAYCNRMSDECPLLDDRGTDTKCTDCAFKWLSLEFEDEKTEPCPFCGDKGEVHLIEIKDPKENFVRCSRCFYTSPHCDYANETVAAHNRVARAVRAAEKGSTDERK